MECCKFQQVLAHMRGFCSGVCKPLTDCKMLFWQMEYFLAIQVRLCCPCRTSVALIVLLPLLALCM